MIESTDAYKKYSKIKRLIKTTKTQDKPTSKNIQNWFDNFAESVKHIQHSTLIQVRLLKGSKSSTWCSRFDNGKYNISRETAEHPDIDITTTEDIFWKIAIGKLSPDEAFIRGELEFHGDCDLLKKLHKKISEKGETVFY
jgi:putative sterol carrier protein